MKNTIRVRRNGANKRTASQVQNHVSQPSEPVPKSCSMFFFDEEAGAIGNGIDLEPEEFAAIQKIARRRNLSLDNCLCQMVSDFIAVRPSENRLEQPIQNVICLLDLLVAKIMAANPERLMPKYPDFDQVYSTEVCGLINLCHQAKKTLMDKFYLTSETEVAS
jgi:hypothetical protein